MDKIDVYKIPNVNFSMISEDDDRWELFKQQRLERGFDDSELWNLDSTIAKFILPRLKAFSENLISHPIGITMEKWEKILNSMIYSFDIIVEDKILNLSDDEYKKFKKGLKLFVKYYFNLWD